MDGMHNKEMVGGARDIDILKWRNVNSLKRDDEQVDDVSLHTYICIRIHTSLYIGTAIFSLTR